MSKFDKSLEEKYGQSGVIGHNGEQFVANVLRSWKWDVFLTEDDITDQSSGVDIKFKSPKWSNPYTADIKSNMDDFGSFYIETDSQGWLFNNRKTSDRIWHCNPDTGWMAWYNRVDMQNYIKDNNLYNTGLYRVTPKQIKNLITRKQYKGTE